MARRRPVRLAFPAAAGGARRHGGAGLRRIAPVKRRSALTRQAGAAAVILDIDTFGGQSGSPVWRFLNGQRHGVAIHTNGVGGCGGSVNCGTRITQPVFDNLVAWKQ